MTMTLTLIGLDGVCFFQYENGVKLEDQCADFDTVLYSNVIQSVYVNICINFITFTTKTPRILTIQFSLLRNSRNSHCIRQTKVVICDLDLSHKEITLKY